MFSQVASPFRITIRGSGWRVAVAIARRPQQRGEGAAPDAAPRAPEGAATLAYDPRSCASASALVISAATALGGELGATFVDFFGFPTSAGPFVTASAGRDGIGLNAGLKGVIQMIIPAGTASIGASGLYLWEGENSAYAGARASASFSLLTVFGGVYRRVSGDRDDDWMFSIGTGVGMP